MFNTGYPVSNFTQTDASGASTNVLYSSTSDGLCVPFFFIMAERGTPGSIVFGGAKELYPILGSRTFDPTSPYYNAATQFLEKAMAGQGVEVMRLVDANATVANTALYADVTVGPITQAEFTAYQTAGSIPIATVFNAATNYVIIKWYTKSIPSGVSYNSLTTTTTVVAGVTTTTYPIIGFQARSVGVYGNNLGFSLYSTGSSDSAIEEGTSSSLYRFVPMELPTTVSTTASPVQDIYGSSYSDVSFKSSAVYAATATDYGFNYIVNTNYIDPISGNSLLPYDTFLYSNNINAIGSAVVSSDPVLAGVDPYLIDLIAGQYPSTVVNPINSNVIIIDPASKTTINSSVVNYLTGGADGDTSFSSLENQIQFWINSNNYGEFTNLQQHPMTHFSDPGFNMPTKLATLRMLDLRDNFKIDLSTQDVSLPPNTQAQDMSAGQALVAQAQLHPNSIITGVGCSRVGVYAHAGKLITGGAYSGLVPFNINRLTQRRDLDGGQYIKGSSGGRPNSEVTMFYKSNWVDDSDTSRQISWASGINTVMHANRTVIFYPSLRTVYPNDTSLFSDDEISDRIIYLYKIAREVWSIYAGVRSVSTKLYPRIQADIDNRANAAFSLDNFIVKSKVFQTAADANLGYSTSINLNISGSMPQRQFNFNVIVSRSS